MIGFIVPSRNALLAMVEQMQVRGSFEEICKNLLIEKEVLRVITEAGLAGKGKMCFQPLIFFFFNFMMYMMTLHFLHKIWCREVVLPLCTCRSLLGFSSHPFSTT